VIFDLAQTCEICSILAAKLFHKLTAQLPLLPIVGLRKLGRLIYGRPM